MSTGLPPPPDAPTDYRLTHRGDVYGLGLGPGFFGIWRLAGGPPVETFERTQAGWEAAWRRFGALDRRERVARWRRGSAGWILLHLAIGVALWFALLIVEAGVLAAADRETEELSDAAGTGVALALPLSISAWILFVYLGSRRARWLALLGLLAAGLAVAIGSGLGTQPAA